MNDISDTTEAAETGTGGKSYPPNTPDSDWSGSPEFQARLTTADQVISQVCRNNPELATPIYQLIGWMRNQGEETCGNLLEAMWVRADLKPRAK